MGPGQGETRYDGSATQCVSGSGGGRNAQVIGPIISINSVISSVIIVFFNSSIIVVLVLSCVASPCLVAAPAVNGTTRVRNPLHHQHHHHQPTLSTHPCQLTLSTYPIITLPTHHINPPYQRINAPNHYPPSQPILSTPPPNQPNRYLFSIDVVVAKQADRKMRSFYTKATQANR